MAGKDIIMVKQKDLKRLHRAMAERQEEQSTSAVEAPERALRRDGTDGWLSS